MFKYEVNINGKTHIEYGINKHADDFIQFLPAHFTRVMGERVLPEHITVYKFDEDDKDFYEGKKAISKHNEEILEAGNSLKVCRVDRAKFKVGDKVELSDYLEKSKEREEKFKDSKDHKDKVVKAPKSKVESVDDGTGTMVDKDIVTIEVGDELAEDLVSTELELIGTPLIQWPYDSKGKFLGNK